MLAASPHRGERTEVAVDGRVALGVCHTADLITASLERRDGRIVAFAGVLDNATELRRELRRAGAPEPVGEAAAATVLAALDWWGEQAVVRLRGKFAAAFTDGRELSCFRDHFGGAPLFCRDALDGFYVATEVKQVLAGSELSPEPDLDHLHGVIFGGVDRSTAYRGVERIPKQRVATAGDRPGLRSRRYWNPADHVESGDHGPEAAVEGTLHAVDRAVRRTLGGRDVLLLSGGLDSPALAACAARAEGLERPVEALTAVYPDYPSADEYEWTRKVADHLGMRLHTFVAEAASMDDVEYWVDVLDGPVDIVSIPEAAEAFRTARELGARTVLNGEIAEMLFENRGYLLDHLLTHGRLPAAARQVAALRETGHSWMEVAKRLVRAVAPASLMTAYRRRHLVELRGVPDWLDQDRLWEASPEPPTWTTSPRRRWSNLQSAPFRGPGLNFEADDVCAAVCGVESRRPFTDVDLWEFVLGLPAEVKFPERRTKPLLRRAMRGLLPHEVIDRRDKTYFDEFHLATADYEKLRRLLVDPGWRLDGIDYEVLAERLQYEEMPVYELQWARDVARVHAFLGLWR